MSGPQINQHKIQYSGIIGTGGIGSGRSFMLNSDHTLGREESRSGRFLDARDYCKQHIILHYMKVLLGPTFSVLPVGKVGNDELGNSLFKEMSETGFNMSHIEKVEGVSTLFSFCFHYPDGTGGNLTTDDSASARVDIAHINKATEAIRSLGPKGIVMAAPEVPLEARLRILELGRKYQSFNAASFTTEEIQLATNSGVMANVDLLAINLDEAAALVNESRTQSNGPTIAMKVVGKLQSFNENIQISITAGVEGSWCWDTEQLHHCSAIDTKVNSTAGAGDAFFSGLLCGIATGISLRESQQLATLVGGLSITSQHTIHPDLNRQLLRKFLQDSQVIFSKEIINILND